jgi:hypothetical protein
MQVQRQKDTADDRFREALQKEEGRQQLTSRKFEEAMKHADELEEPIRPMDLD